MFNCKYLDLHQKWPRPGQKSLEKFIKQNQVSFVFLPTDISFQTCAVESLSTMDITITDPQMGVLGIGSSSLMIVSIGGLLVRLIIIHFEQRTDQLSPLC